MLFDLVGAGGSDLTAFDPDRYSDLRGLRRRRRSRSAASSTCSDVVFVGHSVSAMIGVLAATEEPDRFGRLVLVGPSPRYINDGEYVGGFTAEDIDGLLESLDSNYLGWSSAMAPVIMGNPDRPAARRRADQQLLPHRPGDRPALRPGDVHLGQPGRPRRRPGADAGPAVLGGRDRAGRRRRLRAPPDRRQHPGPPGRHRALPQPQRPGGDGGSDRDLPGLCG